jgi:hypothetical protein
MLKKFLVFCLRAIKTCFFNIFFALFIFLYQYPVKKNISGQFDIFHTTLLQNTSRCHVTASIWILCNILENITHALDEKLVSLTFSLPYLYSYINIQSKKIYQVYGSPIFERINVHMQRYLHQAFNEKIWFFSLQLQFTRNNRNLKINNHNFTYFGQFEVIVA